MADDMGLGKTISVIALLAATRDESIAFGKSFPAGKKGIPSTLSSFGASTRAPLMLSDSDSDSEPEYGGMASTKGKGKAKARSKDPQADEQGRVYVLNFHGDIKASALENLRHEVSAVLEIARPSDEVLVRLESGGGMVHAYGLAASQLVRVREAGIRKSAELDAVTVTRYFANVNDIQLHWLS